MEGGQGPPRSTAESASAVVTKDQAEARARESKSAYSRLMNQMEEAREAQGAFFIAFGNKTPESDDRALLLIRPGRDEKNNGTGWAVITQDGPQISYIQTRDQRMEDLILDLSKGKRFSKVTGEYLRNKSSPRGQLKISYEDNGQDKEVVLDIATYANPSDYVDSAIDESIRWAESPHAIALARATKNIEVASSVSTKLSSLPSRG